MNNVTGMWSVRFLESGYLKFEQLKENSTIDIFDCGGGGGGGTGISLKVGRNNKNDLFYLRAGGGGGGGGYTQNVFAVPVINNEIYSIIVGAGGAGTAEIESSGTLSSKNGSDGQPSQFLHEDTIIINANGGKGGTAATGYYWKDKSAKTILIKTGGRGGAGGSGGGNGGARTLAGGEGGKNGSHGGKGGVYNVSKGGLGSGVSSIPFGEINGNTYGSGGAGGSGTSSGVAASTPLGGSSVPAIGGSFNSLTPGGGNGAFTADTGFTFNKAYMDIVPNSGKEHTGKVLTSGNNAGLTVYPQDNFYVTWKTGIFNATNGTPNTGGGGGGGTYFFKSGDRKFTSVPCLKSETNDTEITTNKETGTHGHYYRGGDGGSGIVIIRGEAINKEEGE